MRLSRVEVLSKEECRVICEWFESEKHKFKISTENGEQYISASESNLTKDFPYIHELLEKKISKNILSKFFPLLGFSEVKKSFACRYTTKTSPSMPFHYDGDDYTVLIYLNENFKGGGTSFPLLNKTLTVKDVGVGNGYIFSGLNPKSWHGALPITSGKRYTISVRIVRTHLLFKIFNMLRIFILIPFTFLLNKSYNLHTK